MDFLRKNKKPILLIGIPLTVIAILFLAAAIYLSGGYEADTEAIAVHSPTLDEIARETDYGIAIGNEQSDTGLIFYPGGKVDHLAYLPLMAELAERGIFCALVEMPFDLAVFGVNAAQGIREMHPDIKEWYIGGHSLGGSMAASYLDGHRDEFKGLVLLASYSTADLSDSNLSVISVYGTEDGVLNMDKYEKYKTRLPASLTESVITGACHAGFAMYGAQKGDGDPTLDTASQIEICAMTVASYIKSGK